LGTSFSFFNAMHRKASELTLKPILRLPVVYIKATFMLFLEVFWQIDTAQLVNIEANRFRGNFPDKILNAAL
jgi:hypothetical protein